MLALALGSAALPAVAKASDRAPSAECASTLRVDWPVAGVRIERAERIGEDSTHGEPMPAHCEIFGLLAQRRGIDGQAYAIRFHLRMPDEWNRRFYFQGGGGTNGEIGDALGRPGFGAPSALAAGYAVVSQDSGHDNRLNNDPAHGGTVAFGFDPQARADYGGASLAPVTLAARAIVSAYYGEKPARSYFLGCSKGGEEGMVLAQRYPNLFDGIVAAAPGFALPRAALAQAWDVQAMATAGFPGGGSGSIDLRSTFGDQALRLVADAILSACDADDGVADGIVPPTGRCTLARVHPELARRQCRQKAADNCLRPTQVAAFERVMAGPRRSDGAPLYTDWPWDPGIAAPGWRMWKIGSADGRIPALNVVLGGSSLPAIFSVPPRTPGADPGALFAAQMAYDFDRDAPAIYASNPAFPRSGWQDVSARSPDLSAFRRHGGKMIVPHGAADPVFSLNDSIEWYKEVQQNAGGHARDFVRLFPVPGMTHCGGGFATDNFDTLTALVAWVEHGIAPDALVAAAGPGSPWPGRTRPVCAYPKTAKYRGRGDREKAGAFRCM